MCMMNKLLMCSSSLLLLLFSCNKKKSQDELQIIHFKPTVESLQEYETPEWFNEAKFGIWVCWNAYAHTAVGDWYARNMYIEGHPHNIHHLKNYGHPSEFGYKDIIQDWKGEYFDAQELVDLFVDVGAKYIVGMANHHDNYDLWDSKHHEWNSVNYGPKRDIMGEFRDAVSKYKFKGIRWGVTSHVERASCWFQTNKGTDTKGPYAGVPYDGNDKKYESLYLPPDPYGDVKPTQPSKAPTYWKENWLARCKDLFDNYDPDFFYVDGGVPFPNDDNGKTGLEMISYLYNQNKDRHNGKNEAVMCIKDWYKRAPKGEWGYYWDGIATLNIERRRLPQIRKQPWQTDTSIGDWTYVKDGEYRSAKVIIDELIDIVSKNGNMLLNVTPMGNGKLDQKAFNLLQEIGPWLKINGESIYGTKPWETSGIGDQRIVKKGDNLLYLSLLEMPENKKIKVPYLAAQKGKSLDITSVTILGHDDKEVEWKLDENGFNAELPFDIDSSMALVLKIEGKSLENFSKESILEISDRNEELTQWWDDIPAKELDNSYKSVATDNKDRAWAIKLDNSLVELIDGKEKQLGVKAIDVGASSSGVVYVALDGSVYFHSFRPLMWVDFPTGEDRISSSTLDGKEWIKLPGIKAKRCDVGQTGMIWVTDENDMVAYYLDAMWKSMDKKAHDIACGGGWVGAIAIISNGQLERFEGTYWENLGGTNFKALDISNSDEIIVALDADGHVTLFDLMGSTHIKSGNKVFNDVSCGLSNGKETIILSKNNR